MQGDPKVIEYLNTVLTNELTAINQYFLHARMLDNWGVTHLGKREYDESIEEMRHADWLIKRILFLEGLPNVQRLNAVLIGQTPEEVLRADKKQEDKAVADLREAIPYCESVRDFPTRDLFSHILRDEEDHIDFIETQLDLLSRIGTQNWIQLNSAPAHDGNAHHGKD
ncbi:MAG TPA: bacterioferritin [Acetobacteraceae bacterium]|nr:bacterioferritin [Acetobacteraceae bacterium]